MNYKINSSEVLFKGKVFDIKLDLLTYDSGNDGRREIVIHNGGSVVVPVKNDGKIILVKQFRYPLQESLFELPAGKLDNGEDPLICATRELKEETGFSTDNITKLGSIYTTPGFCTEELFIFLAKDLQEGEHSREEGEIGMEVFEFTIDEIDQMIMNGEIKDAKTICGINYFRTLSK
jgi:ADP-ribose pyrophosphatase